MFKLIPLEFKILGSAGLLVASFLFGVEWNDRAWSEKVAKAESNQAALVIELERAQQSNTYLLTESVNDILNEQDAEKEIIYRDKVVYRDSPSAGNCSFPIDGVSLINRAAGLPADAKASDNAKAEPSGISDIEVVDTVTANYLMCRKELAKFQGLWEWADRL